MTLYSEIAWFLIHLNNHKVIEFDNNYFSDIDEPLYETALLLLKQGKYDCLNGAISIGLYFCCRYQNGDMKYKMYLEQFIDTS